MNDREYMRRVRAVEGRLYRVAQAMLWREADCLDAVQEAVQEAVFRGWMKKEALHDDERFGHRGRRGPCPAGGGSRRGGRWHGTDKRQGGGEAVRPDRQCLDELL
ncbi:MAG: hypothetical protein IKN05_02905 [Clostridia bacterium]|nr:hypothetical protein [Clostridia bacterium]